MDKESKEEGVTIYVTKYALTQGVLRFDDAEVINDVAVIRQTGCYDTYFHKNQWHRTFEEAKAQAEDMRRRKMASVKKQLAKLEAMTFDAPGGTN